MTRRYLLIFSLLLLAGHATAQVIADFYGGPRSGYAPLTVQFTNNSSNASEYSWSFPYGSPNTATGSGPHLIIYYTPGTFDVSLFVKGGLTHLEVDTKFKEDYITVEVPELDFGDAPAPYPTMKDDPGVMIRSIMPNCKLGALIDGEPDGQPDSLALGDDNSDQDDEDGVTFDWLMQSFTGHAYVDFSDPGLSNYNGFLNAWIDYDQNNAWDDDEKILTSEILSPGQIYDFAFEVPSDAVPGFTFARFVLASANPWIPVSGIPVGEVEDYQVEILSQYDFGDAPAPYPTLLADPGSLYRKAYFGMMLGQNVDTEADGRPYSNAMGDDNTNLDDEDGVTIGSDWGGLLPAMSATATVDFTSPHLEGENGLLDAWIDFNQNGAWENDEQIFNSEILTPGLIHELEFQTPAMAESGKTFARFVLTHSDPGRMSLTGIRVGEVEDHEVEILPVFDFGDAPAPYPTLRSDPGTTYRVSLGGMMLGYQTDAELDGQPHTTALGDDNTGMDDEDGVTIYYLTAGEQGTAYIRYPGSTLPPSQANGLLDAWIDFNQNNAWEENEKVVDSYQLVPSNSVYAVTFDVPATAVPGYTYGRFVLSAETMEPHLNGIPWGEVEDHQIQVLASSDVKLQSGLPTEYALSQNHPNPFNPLTEITYSILRTGQVTLIVYDVRGKIIEILMNKIQSPGNYQYRLNAEDYGSGIYFYKLQAAGEFQAIKKMILLK